MYKAYSLTLDIRNSMEGAFSRGDKSCLFCVVYQFVRECQKSSEKVELYINCCYVKHTEHLILFKPWSAPYSVIHS